MSQRRIVAEFWTWKSTDQGNCGPRSRYEPAWQLELQLDPFVGRDADLSQHVGRMRRSADAIGAQVRLADLGMHAEDQLDRVGEVELEVEMASLAVGMLGDRAERVGDLA